MTPHPPTPPPPTPPTLPENLFIICEESHWPVSKASLISLEKCWTPTQDRRVVIIKGIGTSPKKPDSQSAPGS